MEEIEEEQAAAVNSNPNSRSTSNEVTYSTASDVEDIVINNPPETSTNQTQAPDMAEFLEKTTKNDVVIRKRCK